MQQYGRPASCLMMYSSQQQQQLAPQTSLVWACVGASPIALQEAYLCWQAGSASVQRLMPFDRPLTTPSSLLSDHSDPFPVPSITSDPTVTPSPPPMRDGAQQSMSVARW